MKKILLVILLIVFILVACNTSVGTLPIITITPDATAILTSTNTHIATNTHPTPSLSPTPSLAMLDRPVFLAWPLPPYIGTARISQYPNSPWTWHYLGLNEGYQCPPAFGYLLNLDSLPYWRDTSIPEEQDKAQADPHQFEMVECYSTEGNPGENGHAGTDIKAPAGTPVYASADGKVMEWRLTGLNSMIVLKHCLGGNWDVESHCIEGKQWYTTYMHIIPRQDLLQENKVVIQGDELGTIYDQTINSHLHFALGLESRSYANSVNPWGRDEYSWEDCMWLDQSICVNPAPWYKDMAILFSDGKLLFIPGGRGVIEIEVRQDIKKISLRKKRIAILDSESNLRLFDGYPPPLDLNNWDILARDVLEFQITQERIAILDKNKNLLLQDVTSQGNWFHQAENVKAFSLSDYRIGYLTEDGTLYVKENALESEWDEIGQNVIAFQVIRNRVAFVTGDGKLYVNEGEINSEFKEMAEVVKAFQITDVRLGIIDAHDNLLVKEGNLRANWIQLADDVQSFQMADYRIITYRKDGAFEFKAGNLYQDWSDVIHENLAETVLINGDFPIFINPSH